MPGSLTAARLLEDVVLLNRAVTGSADNVPDPFVDDYDPARDPDAVGLRTELNVYDRYDLYLADFGLRTLSSAELGFAPSEVSASETDANFDRNFTYAGDLYRNNFQKMEDGTFVRFDGAAAVALAAVKEAGTAKTLHLVFRGTDEDGPSADGEAGTGAGQVRYYRQLQPLIDQAFLYASDPANGITEVVVSGHSLGGQMADLFTLYDGARFAALPGIEFRVVSLASAGVEQTTLGLMPDYDQSLVAVGPNGTTFNTPAYYTQYDHSEDIVRNPERYDVARHQQEDPAQAPVTNFSRGTLLEHINFENNRFEFDLPLLDQYEVSAPLDTTFLAEHFVSLYELVGTELAGAAQRATSLDFDRFIALNGINPKLLGASGENVNDFGLPVDDAVNYGAAADDLLVLGLSGNDTVAAGSGSDLLAGGDGDDRLLGGSGADLLIGGAGADRLIGGDGFDTATYSGAAAGVTVFLGGRAGANGEAAGDRLSGVERLIGSGFGDALHGGSAADLLNGLAGDDVLRGAGGNDRLNGGGGDDLLIGDGGADAFVLAAGRDRVRGFEDGADAIDLRLAAAGFDDVVLTSVASGTLVRLDADGDGAAASMLLVGVDRALIGADDFLF